MATRLKNILRFVAAAPGVPTALPHFLNWNGRAVVPDAAWPSVAGFTIAADATNVTVTNTTAAPLNLDVLVESWHTEERDFGAAQTVVLVPQPFVPDYNDGSGAGSVNVEDESIPVGAFGTFNFLGAGVTAVDGGGGVADITIPGGGAGTVDVEDEGVPVGTFGTFNFVGAGVVASDAGGGVTDVTIPGAGAPVGPAGGDLDGNYPDPTIHRPRTSFVFQPGGVAGANVYTDWATMLAAMAFVSGRKAIEFDDSIVSPITLPVGAYNMTNVAWVGAHGGVVGAQASVQLDEGVVISELTEVVGLALFGEATTAPSITENRTIRFRDSFLTSGTAGGTQPLASATSIELYGFTSVSAGVGAVVVLFAGSHVLYDNVEVGADTLNGGVGASVVVVSSGVRLFTQTGTWPGMILNNQVQPRWTVVESTDVANVTVGISTEHVYTGPADSGGVATLFRRLPTSLLVNQGLDVVITNRTTGSITVVTTGADVLIGANTIANGTSRRYTDMGNGTWQEVQQQQDRKQYRVATGASATQLSDTGVLPATVTNTQLLRDGTLTLVEARVLATRLPLSSNERFVVVLRGVLQRGAGAGTTVLVGVVDTVIIHQDAAAITWTATLVANAAVGGVQIQVTGDAGAAINWEGYLHLYELATLPV